MPLRRIERKRASFKTLLHLDALKASKARKIALVPLVPKNSIILSSEAEIFSLLKLSDADADVEDLSLLRLNFFKTSQTSQAVNALTSSELVIFVAQTAATLAARRARMSTSVKLGWFEDENENEKNLDDC